MTALIAGSIAAILISAGTLVFGWLGANESLIWTSIVASVTAAVLLALAYARSRSPRGTPSPPPREG